MTGFFAERLFRVPDGQVRLRFDPPYLAPGGEYRCRWHIEWPGKAIAKETAGIDGVQALMLAMRTVHTELIESDEYKSGELTYLDQSDLDLPPMWGIGSLYDAGSSSTK